MQLINLRKYYPDYYPRDCLIEVTDEIAAAMKPHGLEDATHARRMRRNKVLSLDVCEGIEHLALRLVSTPEELLIQKIMLERLYEAIGQLTPSQAKRIDSFYFPNKHKAKIAREEGCSKAAVGEAIFRALDRMKIRNVRPGRSH